MVLPGTSLDSVRSRKNSSGHSNKSAPLLRPDDPTMPTASSSPTASYTHLVVVCHGAMGWPAHVANLCAAIRLSLGPSALVLAPACFSGFRTLSGTQACGDRVFAEIQAAKAKHRLTLTHISLLGYSFGGILCRWLCGRLYEHNFLGLAPCNFVTIACPHLGVVEDDADDDAVDLTLNAIAQKRSRKSWSAALVQFFVSNAGGATGEELGQSRNDRRALLTWMADPVSPFYQGLKAFQRRSLYASLRGDRTVSFYTAYFPSDGEYSVNSEVCNGIGDIDSVRDDSNRRVKNSSSCSDDRRENDIASTCASCRPSGATLGYVKPSALGALHYPHVFQWLQHLHIQRAQVPQDVGASSSLGINEDDGKNVGGEDNGTRKEEGQSDSEQPEEWEAASSFDALPLLVLVKIMGVVLLASPLLVLWLGVVLPTFTTSRWLIKCAFGPASPPEYPIGLASPCAQNAPHADVSEAPLESAIASPGHNTSRAVLSAESADSVTSSPLTSLQKSPPQPPQVPQLLRPHAKRAEMARHLNALEWHKYVAVFSYAHDGLSAVHTHAPIIFRGANHAAGRDVVQHIAKSLIPAPSSSQASD